MAALLCAFLSGGAAMFAYQRLTGPEVVHANLRPDAALAATPASSPSITVARPVETAIASGVDGPSNRGDEPRAANPPGPAAEASKPLVVAGITEPAPGRFARLPLATSQAVAFVDVKPGDRIKKGWQVFSHWESPDRLQAARIEADKTKRALEIAKARAAGAEQTLERLTKLRGTTSAQEVQDAKMAVDVRRQELQSAELAVSEAESRFAAMDFEFKQAFVTSPIDGVVASVDVVLGERRQIGGAFRGVTVLDARVLQCRCMLTHEQASLLTQAPGVRQAIVESDRQEWPATVTSIGSLADASSGLIPVLLEVQNPDESLRCGIRVSVRFVGVP